MNIPPDAAAIGFVTIGLAALIGIGAGAVGLFVLRVEFAAWCRRVERLEAERRATDGQ